MYITLALSLFLGMTVAEQMDLLKAAETERKWMFYTQVVILVGIIINAYENRRANRKIDENTLVTKNVRQEVRHDVRNEINVAELKKVEIANALAETVKERETRLMKELEEIRREVRNGHGKPEQVVVVNDASRPVPTHETK
jgi:hypothetical protein